MTDIYDGPPREGTRGGLALFTWDSIKGQALRDRDCYLGQSVRVGVQGKFGRFSTNDWWIRKREDPKKISEEQNVVKRFEEELMREALGVKPKRLLLIKGELTEDQKRELLVQTEELEEKMSTEEKQKHKKPKKKDKIKPILQEPRCQNINSCTNNDSRNDQYPKKAWNEKSQLYKTEFQSHHESVEVRNSNGGEFEQLRDRRDPSRYRERSRSLTRWEERSKTNRNYFRYKEDGKRRNDRDKREDRERMDDVEKRKDTERKDTRGKDNGERRDERGEKRDYKEEGRDRGERRDYRGERRDFRGRDEREDIRRKKDGGRNEYGGDSRNGNFIRERDSFCSRH